jgi:hypothetical protein
LLDEPDGVLRAVKGDGAEMLGAAPDGDVHRFIFAVIASRSDGIGKHINFSGQKLR